MKKIKPDTMCVLVREVHQTSGTHVSTFVGTFSECLKEKDHHLKRDCYWNDNEVLLGPKRNLKYTLKAKGFFSKVRIVPAIR